MHVATIPSIILAIETTFAVGVLVKPGTVYGFLTVVFGSLGGLLLYVLFARSLRIKEVSGLMAIVGARFGGGSPPR
jgi:hypothetical protein